MPVVLLEALAAGCIIVATPTGGIPELIKDKQNGFLVKSADVNALTQGIKQALRLKATDRAIQIRKKAQETAMPFDWSEIAIRYYALLETITQ